MGKQKNDSVPRTPTTGAPADVEPGQGPDTKKGKTRPEPKKTGESAHRAKKKMSRPRR